MNSSNHYMEKAKFAAAVGILVWLAVIWTICLLGCISARKRYRLRPRSPLASLPASAVPGVSIIRPLKGLDPNIFDNLESTFAQNYPKFEILLSVADENDPVIPVVRELAEKYSHIDSKLIIGDESVGVNPKVNNLARPFREASHDIVWVLDSGVQVSPDTLARSVDALENPSASDKQSGKRIGLVHHVPIVEASSLVDSDFLGTRLEVVFLNTTHAKMYIALNAMAIDSCVVGKSNLYRRSDISLLNGTLKPRNDSTELLPRGIEAFGKFLAEDNMIAGALWHELDQRHSLSCDVAYNAIGNMKLQDYIRRRIRWIRVRKRMVAAATIIEPLTEFVLLTILSSWALHALSHVPWWVFVPLHFGCWLAIDLDVYLSLLGHPLPSSHRPTFITAWFLREFLAFPIWIIAIIGNDVQWRGVKYRVLRNGEVERVNGPLKLATKDTFSA